MANLPSAMSFNEYKHHLSLAYGFYDGDISVALGFSGISENRKLNYKVSGSVNGKGKIAFGGGVGVMLGDKQKKNDLNAPKDVYERLDKLEKENQELKELIKKLLDR